tara:strand:+ start:1834 stop:2418 length:585 start_codon:yes stop_codon:yes gene_type:complete
MAYYYKGAKILAPLTIRSNEPIYEVDTVSLSKQRASQGAQRWEVSFKAVTSADTEADMLVGTITNLTASTTMIMPQIPSVVAGNTAGISLVISSVASAGASTVTIVNDGIIKKGSFIKFSNHDKIYMVTEDVSSGTVNVPIYPSLRSAVAITDTFQTGSYAVLSYYRNIDNLTGLTFSDGLISNAGSISLTEAI